MTVRLDWRSRRALLRLWKPEYDVLWLFNADVARGVKFDDDPEFVATMASVQTEYNLVFLPALETARAKQNA